MEERKDFEDLADFNVVIWPDEKTSHAVIAWSELIASRFPTAYTLNSRDMLPHLSICAARYPDRNQDAVEKIVDDLTAHCEAFDVALSGFSVFSEYIFYDAILHEKLKAFHEAIVDALNLLREGQVRDNQRQQTGLTVEQQRAIEKYGYMSVKDHTYLPPYITIAAFFRRLHCFGGTGERLQPHLQCGELFFIELAEQEAYLLQAVLAQMFNEILSCLGEMDQGMTPILWVLGTLSQASAHQLFHQMARGGQPDVQLFGDSTHRRNMLP